MIEKTLQEIKEKLNIILSMFSVKDEDGKTKTLLEKYNETIKEKEEKTMLDIYKINAKTPTYDERLKTIMAEYYETGSTPKTDKDGYFEHEGAVYNIKDYK